MLQYIYLCKGDLMPSNREFVVLEEFVKTMKPIVEICNQVN